MRIFYLDGISRSVQGGPTLLVLSGTPPSGSRTFLNVHYKIEPI